MNDYDQLKPLADWMGEVMAEYLGYEPCDGTREDMWNRVHGWADYELPAIGAEFSGWLVERRDRYRALALIRKARRQRDEQAAKLVSMRAAYEAMAHERNASRAAHANTAKSLAGERDRLIELHIDDEAILERQRDGHRDTLRTLWTSPTFRDEYGGFIRQHEPWLMKENDG